MFSVFGKSFSVGFWDFGLFGLWLSLFRALLGLCFLFFVASCRCPGFAGFRCSKIFGLFGCWVLFVYQILKCWFSCAGPSCEDLGSHIRRTGNVASIAFLPVERQWKKWYVLKEKLCEEGRVPLDGPCRRGHLDGYKFQETDGPSSETEFTYLRKRENFKFLIKSGVGWLGWLGWPS